MTERAPAGVHVSDEEITLHYYGEASDFSGVERHLASCPDCRVRFEAIQGVLNTIEAPEAPWRPERYGAQVWDRIAPELRRRRGRRTFGPAAWWPRRLVWSPGRAALAGACAALALAGVAVGWLWPGILDEQPAPTAARRSSPAAAAEAEGAIDARRILLVTIGDHLDRSQVALIELANMTPGRHVDLSAEQAWAEDLVADNRLYRQAAALQGEMDVADVLDELERVLLEIARGPSTLGARDFEHLRQRLEARGILFKVRVLGTRIRQDTARGPA